MATQLPLIYDLNIGWRYLNITDIYLGPDSSNGGRIVPNVGDKIFDRYNGEFIVVAVEPKPSSIPTLARWDPAAVGNNNLNSNLLVQLESYQPHINERAFLDTTVTPHTLTIDGRFRLWGVDAVSAKLFRGTDTESSSAVVISQMYNVNGNIIGENVDLEPVDPNNPAIKRPRIIYTGTNMMDGDIVTLVSYMQGGGVYSKVIFLVVLSNAIRALEMNALVVIDIELVTNMLDGLDKNLVLVPANVPISGSDFQAKLLYNDGSSVIIPIGTNKCKIHNLTNVNTSQAGQKSTVVLSYYPDKNEPIINSSNPNLPGLSKSYKIQTTSNVLDKSFRVYIAPYWDSVLNTYSLKMYLTNLDYDILIELNNTQYSLIVQGGAQLNVSKYAEMQSLVISVHMDRVFQYGYDGYIFVQRVNLNLGDPLDIPWIIDYKGDQTNMYGGLAKFSYYNNILYPMELKSGAVTPVQWKDRLFDTLNAIYNPNQFGPPEPTHFRLKYNGYITNDKIINDEFGIKVNNELHQQWILHDTVEVIWLLDVPGQVDKKILGISPVMIYDNLI